MAGFTCMDKQSNMILEVNVAVDTIYPPSINFNISQMTATGPDRKNSVWGKANANQFMDLYNNLVDSTTNPKITYTMKEQQCFVGLENGYFYVCNGYQTVCVAMDPDAVGLLAQYVYDWHIHGAFAKDLFESIKVSIGQEIQAAVMSTLEMLSENLNIPGLKLQQTPRLYMPKTTRSGNNYQGSGFKAGGNQNQNSAPQFAGAPQFKTPPFAKPPVEPQKKASMPIPTRPPQPNAMGPSTIGAPIPMSKPPMQGIPMGVNIPSTPNSTEGKAAFGAEIGNMLKANQFGSIPQQ